MDSNAKDRLLENIDQATDEEIAQMISFAKSLPSDEIIQQYSGSISYIEFTAQEFLDLLKEEGLYSDEKSLEKLTRPHLKLYTQQDARHDQKEKFKKAWVDGGVKLAGQLRLVNARKKNLIRSVALAASIIISILLLPTFFLVAHKNNNTLEAKNNLIDIKLTPSCDSQYWHKYKDIEVLIDNYLLHINNGDDKAAALSIQQAQSLADDIAANLKDRFPQAEIGFYSLIKKENIKDYLLIRNTINEVESTPSGDLYTVNLKKLNEVLILSESLNAQIEILRINILQTKLLTKLNKADLAMELADKNISIAEKANYKIIKLNSLIWKKEASFFKNSFDDSIDLFGQTISLACELGNEKARSGALMSIAAIYNQINQDTEAARYASIGLSIKELDLAYKIQLLNLLAVSKFNLGERELALQINQQAINESTGQYKAYKIVGLCFSGMMEGRSQSFDKALAFFDQAEVELKSIIDDTMRLKFRSTICAYKGKVLATKGDYSSATILYRESIACADQINLNQDFYMAQLYDGLATCLQKTGRSDLAKKEQRKAFDLFNNSKAKTENMNNFFLVSLSNNFTH